MQPGEGERRVFVALDFRAVTGVQSDSVVRAELSEWGFDASSLAPRAWKHAARAGTFQGILWRRRRPPGSDGNGDMYLQG